MNTTLRRLGIGTLSALIGGTAAAVDTSSWKCETCPFEKGLAATVEGGIGVTSDRSPIYGDVTGLDRRGGHLVARGEMRWRSGDGLYANLSGNDLGLSSRTIAGDVGREGLFALRLVYDEIPRHFADGARTPFIGAGGTSLTLPAGFPAGTTAAMPLATTLQPIDLGYDRKRLEAAASAMTGDAWSWQIGARRDVRDGTRPGAGSFFASAAQLPLPLDQRTDQFELSGHYSGSRLQVSVGWHASNFDDDAGALTWSNPFTPVVAGATRASLALPPDNQFHQFSVSAGYSVAPGVRIAADVAAGRMTQDAALLPLTSNATLAAGSLPASSLHGRVSTLNASLRFSAEISAQLRVHGSVAHDERDNETPVLLWPGVAPDVFVTEAARNRPYGWRQDRARLQLDWRGARALKVSAGAEHDRIDRNLQESGQTREDKVWARVASPLGEQLSLALKLTHADRKAENPGVFTTAENPLLRRYSLGDRRRDAAALRADIVATDTITLGVDAEAAADEYPGADVGLRRTRAMSLGADAAIAATDETQLHAFARGEQFRARQGGSQTVGVADWTGQVIDRIELLGAGIRHAALKNRLVLGADLLLLRARSQVRVTTGSATPSYPPAITSRDTLTAHATWQLQPNLWLVTRYAYEHWRAQSWSYDGVTPSAIDNLLAFGTLVPRAHQQVLSVAVRHRF